MYVDDNNEINQIVGVMCTCVCGVI